MQEDEKYMKRCFDLALKGRGNVSPNPKVGAVIVCEGKIIGEGYHKKYGEAHAEVNAIASVEDKSLLEKSTIYVNLEPCCHWGKTPPCANLIVESKIKRCVISNKDINPKVFGGGIKLLQDNGIEVVSGVLEKEGWYLNRRFFTNQKEKRPYIIIKYAQTLDGYIAPEGKGGWISNDAMKVWVHKQRAEEDAIMVGYNTVLSDNPQLNTRHYYGRNPKRVVYDRYLDLSSDYNIMDKTQETIILNHVKDYEDGNNIYVKINEKESFVPQVLEKLYALKISSIVVEGGTKIINKFIEANMWDEANVIIGQNTFGKGVEAPVIPHGLAEIENIGGDTLKIYYNQKYF